jgi:hypothetical protein
MIGGHFWRWWQGRIFGNLEVFCLIPSTEVFQVRFSGHLEILCETLLLELLFILFPLLGINDP